MTWWQILLAIIFMVPWVYLFLIEVILEPFIQNRRYHKNYIKWNKEHPNLQRIKCIFCKYSKKETLWAGHYPNAIPSRHVVYCSLTKRKINGNHSKCSIAEPPSEYFYKPTNFKYPTPSSDTIKYYSAYGDCYHSIPNCRSIKNSHHLYHSRICPTDRYPCPKCWEEKDGILYPKK